MNRQIICVLLWINVNRIVWQRLTRGNYKYFHPINIDFIFLKIVWIFIVLEIVREINPHTRTLSSHTKIRLSIWDQWDAAQCFHISNEMDLLWWHLTLPGIWCPFVQANIKWPDMLMEKREIEIHNTHNKQLHSTLDNFFSLTLSPTRFFLSFCSGNLKREGKKRWRKHQK